MGASRWRRENLKKQERTKALGSSAAENSSSQVATKKNGNPRHWDCRWRGLSRIESLFDRLQEVGLHAGGEVEDVLLLEVAALNLNEEPVVHYQLAHALVFLQGEGVAAHFFHFHAGKASDGGIAHEGHDLADHGGVGDDGDIGIALALGVFPFHRGAATERGQSVRVVDLAAFPFANCVWQGGRDGATFFLIDRVDGDLQAGGGFGVFAFFVKLEGFFDGVFHFVSESEVRH